MGGAGAYARTTAIHDVSIREAAAAAAATAVDFCRLIYQPCSAGSGCRRIRKATLRRHLQNVCPLDAQAPNAYSADRKLTASPSPIMRDDVGGGHVASS